MSFRIPTALRVAAVLVVLAVATASVAVASGARPPDPVRYQIDPAHSQVGFEITHLGFTTVSGRFGSFTGAIHMEPGDLSTLHVEGSIESSSIDTGVEARDNHLRSADFFDVERFPEIGFMTRRATALAEGDFRLVGDLTMHGVIREVTLEGTYGGDIEDPWGNIRGVFAATTTISREAFGISWNQFLESGILRLSDEVQVKLSAEAVRQEGGS